MERDAKYAAVAAFALLAIAAAVAFVWWYSGRGDRRDYVRYEIYFDGSVSGLSRGSPVRYLGVDVGRVQGLTVQRSHAGRVKVVADIDSEAPISGATIATLGLLGLTGLLYIDLQQSPGASPDTPLVEGDAYPVIESRKGDIEAFLEKMPDLMGRIARVVERVERLLSDKNLEAVSTTLANVESASQDLPAMSRNAAALTADLRGTSQQVNELMKSLRSLTDEASPQIETTLASVTASADKLNRTADGLERIVVDNEATLSQFAGSGVSDLQQLIIDLRATSDEVRELARSLRDRPSGLLIQQKETGMEIPP
jgi:phospholipid/cholesterol/gamma-HCH transport system substrate-binding protein